MCVYVQDIKTEIERQRERERQVMRAQQGINSIEQKEGNLPTLQVTFERGLLAKMEV